MPTPLERRGDFSQTRDAFGQSVSIVDPNTGLPFPGGVIPANRISPQAAALLGYYPDPNLGGADRFNYQRTVLTSATQHSAQARLTQPVNTRNQLFGTMAYQRTTTTSANLFGFEDVRGVSNVEAAANWSYRFSQFLSLRTRYQFTRLATRTTPYFADRVNVSGEAGIMGNAQDPANWGPPDLVFGSGIAGLADRLPELTRSSASAWSAEALASRGRHYVTVGGVVRRHQIDIRSQLNPRGTFSFEGALTGDDFADFLLGVPQTSTIAFGNADKDLRAYSYAAYMNDDWRVSPGLTLTVGLRWEYEAPLTERLGRLVNLDVAAGFAAVGQVLPDDLVGGLTGRRYSASLMDPDRLGVQPRLALAWRPVAGSSLVVRAGYGIYRNADVYESVARLLAQQPPFSKAFSVDGSDAHPLSLADGFTTVPEAVSNTFAVDPSFRVGFAHNWQVSVQRDLPASLTVIGTYRGAYGSRLPQQILPNTYSCRRDAGMCDLPDRVHLSDVERHLVSACGAGPTQASASQRAHRVGPVHIVEGRRRCCRLQRRQSGGGLDRPGLAGAGNGNRKPHICGNRKLHTPGEDVSGGADILPVMPVGRVGLDAGSGATGVQPNTRREAAEPAVTLRLPHAVRPTLSSASADAPASGSCCPGC